MKKFLEVLLVLAILVAGLGYFLYPAVSNEIFQYHESERIDSQTARIASLSDGERDEILRQAESYNGNLKETVLTDVFTRGTERVEMPEEIDPYAKQLNGVQGVMGTLEIPKLDVRLPFYHSNAGQLMGERLVHLEGTKLPVGGEGMTVIAGPGSLPAPEGVLRDLNLSRAWLLKDLGKLTGGDYFLIRVYGRTMVYEVARVWSVSYNALADLELEEDQDTAVLMTQQGNQRLLVQGRRVEISKAAEVLDRGDRANMPPDALSVVIFGAPILVLGLLATLIIGLFTRRKYRIPGERRYNKKYAGLEMEPLPEMKPLVEDIEMPEDPDEEEPEEKPAQPETTPEETDAGEPAESRPGETPESGPAEEPRKPEGKENDPE